MSEPNLYLKKKQQNVFARLWQFQFLLARVIVGKTGTIRAFVFVVVVPVHCTINCIQGSTPFSVICSMAL
jgi:hypothetical protein